MVRTVSICKHFKDSKRGVVKAVDGISLEAHPGQIFGILGCNGAGKTTLLRMLSTVLTPTSGTADVGGFDVVRDSERVRASIGFLSSTTALYGRLNPIELLEYFGGLYGLKGSALKQRVDYVVAKLDLNEFTDRLCDKLSTGQKQRVSIARTILHDPPVLFFDEPTAGLDVVTSQTIMGYVEEARAQGKTVIYCTHIMSEAERLCDRLALLHDGVVHAEGTAEELKTRAESPNLEVAFLRLIGEQKPLAGGVA
ncbi:MAG: ATP-binding cassette domain-containing protein [Fimbriimonadaceae bacterium]|nr:ATP-binding cassette domain-containing protein [Chthonomonadaceae bacterium]MCO5295301.1 ATP-binding cassette domain-containing protein [Fimbriimonadaceae bacterium]